MSLETFDSTRFNTAGYFRESVSNHPLHSEFKHRLESKFCVTEDPNRPESHRLVCTTGVPTTPDLGRYRSHPLPSPESSTASPGAERPQDPKQTTLPSFRELEAFPSRLHSPVSDMSRPSDTGVSQVYQQSTPSDKYTQSAQPEQVSYPYNNRYIQGEPTYHNTWHSAYMRNTPPLVTNISPHAIHSSPYANVGRSAVMMGRRKAMRGDPDYVKRPRRKAEEVERVYSCNFPGCDKAYGALNHLNTHVRNAEHGPKREPKEFAQIRRDQKARMAREREVQNAAIYRQAGNAVYHTRRFDIPQSTTYEYTQRGSVPLTSSTFDLFPARYDRTPVPVQVPPQDIFARSRRYELPEERGLLDGLSIPPAQLSRPATSWSTDNNYSDLHTRYPTFAKDLVTQAPQRGGTLSPRDDDWADDQYEYTSGHGVNFGHAPNGANKGPYSVRKDL